MTNVEANAPRVTVSRIGFFAGPMLAIITYLLLPAEYRASHGEVIAFTHAGRATAGLMVWMAAWWLTEAIDISATSLLPLLILPITGAASMKNAAAPYGSDLIFLFLGGFILALSMQRWGLDRRIALLTLRIVGTKPDRMVGGIMLATASMSAFASNTAVAAVMLPVGLSLTALAGSPAPVGAEVAGRRNFGVCLMLGIAYAASIGGVATIIGTPGNTFLVGFVRDELGQEISFVKWMAIGVPLAAVFLPVTWFLLTHVLYPLRGDSISGEREFVAQSMKELGRASRGEVITFIVFVITAMVWMVRPWLTKLPVGGITPLSGLTDAGVAIAAAMALFVIPVNWRERQFTMDWNTASKLPWGILILFGGGLSLASAIEANGVAQYIGSHAHGFAGVHPLIVVVAVTTAVIVLSELASNTATITTLVPILAALAPGMNLPPLLLIIPATLAASCAFMLPVGTPPNAMVFASGQITTRQMARAGLWLNIGGVIIITLVTFLLARPVLKIGF